MVDLVTHSPYCGDELASVSRETGQATCPEHGPLNIEVQVFRDAAERGIAG